MTKGYHAYKDETKLAWLDNRDQVKLDLRKLLRRVENDVLFELETLFLSALSRGELIELRPPEAALKALVAEHAKALNA